MSRRLSRYSLIALHRTRIVVSISLALTLMTGFSGLAQEDLANELIVKEVLLRRSVSTIIKDHQGFLWLGTDGGLYRFDGYDYDLAGADALSALSIPAVSVPSVVEDDLHRLWVCTMTDVYVIDASRTRIRDASSVYHVNGLSREITSLLPVGKEIWLTDQSNNIVCLGMQEDTASGISVTRSIALPKEISLRLLYALPDGNILVSTSANNYFVLTPQGKILAANSAPSAFPSFVIDTSMTRVMMFGEMQLSALNLYDNSQSPLISVAEAFGRQSPTWVVKAMYADKPGFWLGSRKGDLLWYSPDKGDYVNLTPMLSNRIYAGRFFSLFCALKDGENGLWIGTNQGLLYLQVPQRQRFRILPQPKSIGSQNLSARGLLRARDSSLFVGSYAGFFRYYPNGRIKEYQVRKEEDGSLVNPLAYHLLEDQDGLWIATEGNGIVRLDYASDTLQSIMSAKSVEGLDPYRKSVLWEFKVVRDHAGVFWLGTSHGLFTYTEGDKMPRPFLLPDSIPQFYKVYDIVELESGELLAGCAIGLFSFSPDRKRIQRHTQISDGDIGVTCIKPMEDGRLVIGTKGEGVKIYNPGIGIVEVYNSTNGLADNAVCAIEQGADDMYWVSTNGGITRIDFADKRCRSYFLEDGLPDNEFNHGSSMADPSGELYFGSVGGVVSFQQDNATDHGNPPILRVSKIAYHDGKAGETRYVSVPSGEMPKINLGYRDKYFTVFYSTDKCEPFSRQAFSYQLEGLNTQWQSNGTKNSILFTGLQAGHYTLRIRTQETSPEDTENILRIPVFIERPFYKQWWAYALYVLVFGGILTLVFRGYFQRKHMQRSLQLELEHSHKLAEINKSKSAFFTNITHEFKTPLTLIQGPAEEIKHLTQDPRITKHANLIARNSDAMLTLVNQLLELGKLDAQLEQPHFYRLELTRYMRIWIGNFESLAAQKEIALNLKLPQDAVYADFDPVKLETVVNNLLSNALKFTPGEGTVECSLEAITKDDGTPWLLLKVRDTGPGIDPEEQKHVFERFYQGKQSQFGGTGIGLAFVDEIVRLHNGHVRVQSDPGQGACFSIEIPVFQASTETNGSPFSGQKSEIEYVADDLRKVDATTSERYELLIAEDHPDVAQLIREAFVSDFEITVVSNGRDAFSRATENIPDIIITDVMMPIMDGLTLTHQLKTGIQTSHIPVVMLTARDGLESRIEGRTHGADVYLNKPFSVSELKLVVRNLLYLRLQAQQNAIQQTTQDVTGVQFADTQDKTFYQAFLDIVERNLAEPELSVQDFIRELGVSRTQLHRKLKAITGQSVNTLVRTFRLQRALALLQQPGKNISEVAYEVGFSSPSYFTERFKEYYGYPPSEAHEHRQTEAR